MNARRAALVIAAAALAVAAILVPPREAFPLTTYAGLSGLAAVAGLAGLALLAAGAVAALAGAPFAVATTATAAGAAWFGADLAGWDGGPGLTRALGAAAAPLLLALLVHLVVAAVRARARSALAVLYGISVLAALSRAFLREPFSDPDCWADCGGNPLLIANERGVVSALEAVWHGSALVAGAALAAWAAWSLVRATPPARVLRAPVLGPAVLVGLAEAAYGAALLVGPPESPSRDGFAFVFAARAIGVAGLGLGVAWSALAARRTRASLARLGADLGTAPSPGALRSALSRALGDPNLEVAYAIDGRHLDASGNPVSLADDGRAHTAIAREDEVLAVVVHDPALLGEALQREIGSAARLAVDNERLQAELLARLGAVRASRARIVEAGDAERRRLERDLHDGAQQRLLAASFELRVAHGEARAAGDPVLAGVLGRAATEAAEAIEALRDLAHGIFPAVLSEAGLAAALESLADIAALPVELDVGIEDRAPAPVESAAYVVVAEGVADAARRGAASVRVAVHRSADVLAVEVAEEGAPAPAAAAPLDARHLHLADRAAALGGRLSARPGVLRVELPCA